MSTEWEALGPFPAGMREHPLVSSPLHAFTAPVPASSSSDADIAFAFCEYDSFHPPTAYARGGVSLWKKLRADDTGTVSLSYPDSDVDWSALRGDHGWNSLQFRAELRRRITIAQPCIRIDALGITEYAFVRDGDTAARWYNGDMYSFGADTAGGGQVSLFARDLCVPPGEYVLLVRTLYEVRMFGDPGNKPPEIKITFRITQDEADEAHACEGVPEPRAVLDPSLGFFPDIVDGFFTGDWASVGVRVLPHPRGGLPRTVTASLEARWETSTKTGSGELAAGPNRFTLQPVNIIEGQTRLLPLRIVAPDEALAEGITAITLYLTIGSHTTAWHRELERKTRSEPLRMTFASPATTGLPAQVSLAMALPPTTTTNPTAQPPVLLALHGAGVPVDSPFWIAEIPRLPDMWAVLPSGHNEWGEDWHGGSMADVWAARDMLGVVAKRLTGKDVSRETLLVGHSNGGQGAWYAAARFPDRIRGLIAAAGYLKIQDYVPYTELTSNHYADPALMGILSAALAPFNNDLYASNLASVPILALHGGADDNVPPRHSRTHVSVLLSWLHTTASPDITFVEVPGGAHWWPGIFSHPAVLKFVDTLPPQRTIDEVRDRGFTLATANPNESGSKAGIRIVELGMPGRLARLDVNAPQWKRDGQLSLHSTNVKRIEVTGWLAAEYERGDVSADAKGSATRPSDRTPQPQPMALVRENRQWKPDTRPRPIPPTRAYGPMIRMLSTTSPLVLVVPDLPSAAGAAGAPKVVEQIYSLATRYAHDVYVYHRIDCEIVAAGDALRRVAMGDLDGNVVAFGRPEENRFVEWLIRQKQTPVRFPTRTIFTVDGRLVYEPGSGIITLHPHPTVPSRLVALVAGNDHLGLELAARLLPLRTGVLVPDWAVVTARCRWQGAGGLAGAGFWSGDWGWGDMCWMDRE